MPLSDQEKSAMTITETDLRGPCYRLNRVLQDLAARIPSAQQSAAQQSWIRYGALADRPKGAGLPDGAIYVATDTLTIYEVQNNAWVSVLWTARASVLLHTGSVADTAIQETTGVIAPAGTYEVICIMNVAVAGAAGTAALSIKWTDQNAIARTATAVTLASLNSTTSSGYTVVGLRTGGAVDIKYNVVQSLGAGAKWDLDLIVRRIGP